MKKILPVCSLLLLFSGFAFGQTKEIDSLKTILKKTNSDTTRIDIITTITAKYISIDLDSFNLYTNQAWKLSQKNDNYRLSRIYSDKAIVKIMIEAEMDSARFYLDKALIELDKTEDLATRGAVYSNFAMSYQNSDEFDIRMEYMLKAAEILKEDYSRLCISHYNIAMTYSFANFGDLTVKHLKLALNSAEKSENKMVEALAQRGLANYEIDEKKYEIAKARLEKGLALCKELNSPKVCLEINLELARLYEELGQVRESKKALLLAQKYAIKYSDSYDIMSVKVQLAEQELREENFDSAAQYFEEFYKIYEERPEPQLGIHAFYDWASVETKIGNHKKANILLEKHIIIRDSTFSVENRNALADADAKYENAKKDKEIAEQKLALTESKSKTRTMNILIVSLLLGSILLWFSFRQRQKRMQQQLVSIEREQEVRTLESLMEGEEKERLRIAKELHDGVNGDLSAIKFKLVSLLETNNTVINEVVAMIDSSCEQVRSISHNLVPPSLRHFDLLEAVETYCDDMNAIHKPEITFQDVGDAIVLEKKQEANVFRIIQELVTNSIKHAEAKEILVQLSNVENNLQLTVEDDGKGFDIDQVKSDGIGMQNIRSRVAYLDAALDIKSDSKGSSFTISLNDKT